MKARTVLALLAAAAVLWLATITHARVFPRIRVGNSTPVAATAAAETEKEARRWVEMQSPVGRSAGIILRIEGNGGLLLEQKDQGYPLAMWRDSFDLPGGNGLEHETYLEILQRELSEEFSPEFAERL
eukprot:SAG31_NODE_9644_length_1246_cov_1.754141_1_plen_127_part_01